MLPGPVVQLVRTLACHARGRGFESHPGRHHLKAIRYYPPRGFSSFGRARPCQGRGGGFEPRNPLQKAKAPPNRAVPLLFGGLRACEGSAPICAANWLAGQVSPWRNLAFQTACGLKMSSNELALRRVTEVFATAKRRRFALQIPENFARDLRTVETCEASGMPCPYKSSTCGPNSPCGE